VLNLHLMTIKGKRQILSQTKLIFYSVVTCFRLNQSIIETLTTYIVIAGTMQLYVKTEGLKAKVTGSKGFHCKGIHSTEDRSRSKVTYGFCVILQSYLMELSQDIALCVLSICQLTGMCRHYPAKHTKKKIVSECVVSNAS